MVKSVNLKEYIEALCYNKDNTYTRTEIVNALVDAIENLELIRVVQTLPTSNIKNNKLYFVPNNIGLNEENQYDVFVRINNKWEQIDSLEFNINDYYTSEETDTLLAGKSDIGHKHTTNDVTDTSAYANIGSATNATQKTINNNINTKIGTINTTLGTKANSSDVYLKTETYTRTEISNEITNALSNLQLVEVVQTLPTSNIKNNKLYLVANTLQANRNVYEIYIYNNNNWEQIDALEIDITNFYTKSETETLLNGKANTSHTHTKSQITDFPTSMTPTSHTHGNITNTGAIGSTANLPVITTTSGKLTTGSFEDASVNIQMNGTASAGASNKFSRADHVHPSDTNKSKVSYSQTIKSTDTGSVKLGTITIDGVSTDVYCKDTNTVYTHPTYSNVAKDSVGLYKIQTNNLGHIISISDVTKADITGLGIPASDTVYTHPSHTAYNGGLYKVTINALGHVTSATAVTKDDITALGIPSTNTTYNDVTQSANGLMTKEDKSKLDKSMAVGFGTLGGTTSAYTVSITGVTLTHGTLITVYNAVGANVANATLNVNSLGAKPLYYKASAIPASRFPNKSTVILLYNTSIVSTGCWQLIYSYDSDSTYSLTNLKDSNAHSNLGTSANASQADINTAIDTKIATKVDKEEDKVLSTNDYTTDEKNKLSGIATGANNYTHPTYTARTGKPTANATPSFGGTVTVSQITSDASGHVTGATDRTITIPSTTATTSTYGLVKVDSALSSTSTNPVQNKAIQTALTNLQNGIANIELIEVITDFPTTNISTNKLYFKANNTSESENLYDIYAYVNEKWEHIDALNIDISEYLKKSDLTAGTGLSKSGTTLSVNYGTTATTACAGNDSRLSNARTPTSHTHGALANGGTLNSDITSVNKVAVTDSSNNLKTISKLPSANVTHQDISGKEDAVNKVTSLSTTSTDAEYPSAKAVYDLKTELDDDILEAMANPITDPLIITFYGSEFKCHKSGLVINRNKDSIIIDYGDGTILKDTDYMGDTAPVTGGSMWENLNVVHPANHTYEEDGLHMVKIYNVTDLVGTFARTSSSNDDDSVLLQSVEIPNSVKIISNNCFYYQTNIDIQELKNMDMVINGAFSNCTGLTSLNIENINEIGGAVFAGCTGLTSLNIRNVEHIYDSAFNGSPNITSLSIENVNHIENSIFLANNDALINEFTPFDNMGTLFFGLGVWTVDELIFDKGSYTSAIFYSANIKKLILDGIIPKPPFEKLIVEGYIETIICRKPYPLDILPYMTKNTVNFIFPSDMQGRGIEILEGDSPFTSSTQKIVFKSKIHPTATSKTFSNIPTNCKIYAPASVLNGYKNATNYPDPLTHTYIPIPDALLDMDDEMEMIRMADALYDVDTVEATVTYDDDSTETLNIVVAPQQNGG